MDEDRFVSGSGREPTAEGLRREVRSLVSRLARPLGVMGLHADLVETLISRIGDERERARLESSLRDLREEIDRVGNLAESWQHYVDVGDIHWEDVALAGVVEAAVGSPAPAELDVYVEGDVPRVRGDAEHLATAVSELAHNALAAAPPGTIVSITVTGDAEQAVLEVNDAGPGIDEAARERVFDAFYTTRPDRPGIGLTLARRVARLHGGDLVLAGDAANPGTTFRMTLPAAR